MIDHDTAAPVEEVYMLHARRAVAQLLFMAASRAGGMQLTREERAYFAETLPDETLTERQLEARLNRVTRMPSPERQEGTPIA